jgi:hypothetical protein
MKQWSTRAKPVWSNNSSPARQADLRRDGAGDTLHKVFPSIGISCQRSAGRLIVAQDGKTFLQRYARHTQGWGNFDGLAPGSHRSEHEQAFVKTSLHNIVRQIGVRLFASCVDRLQAADQSARRNPAHNVGMLELKGFQSIQQDRFKARRLGSEVLADDLFDA